MVVRFFTDEEKASEQVVEESTDDEEDVLGRNGLSLKDLHEDWRNQEEVEHDHQNEGHHWGNHVYERHYQFRHRLDHEEESDKARPWDDDSDYHVGIQPGLILKVDKILWV